MLAELEHLWQRSWDSERDMLLYVGCSRACNHLIVMLSDEADPKLVMAFEKKL